MAWARDFTAGPDEALTGASQTLALQISGNAGRMVVLHVSSLTRTVTTSGAKFDSAGINVSADGVIGPANSGVYYDYLFYWKDATLPAAGTYNITVTPSGAIQDMVLGAICYSGLRQDVVPEASGTDPEASANACSVTKASLTAGALALATIAMINGRTVTPSGVTNRVAFDGGNIFTRSYLGDATGGAPGNVTVGYTWDGAACLGLECMAIFGVPASGAGVVSGGTSTVTVVASKLGLKAITAAAAAVSTVVLAAGLIRPLAFASPAQGQATVSVVMGYLGLHALTATVTGTASVVVRFLGLHSRNAVVNGVATPIVTLNAHRYLTVNAGGRGTVSVFRAGQSAAVSLMPALGLETPLKVGRRGV